MVKQFDVMSINILVAEHPIHSSIFSSTVLMLVLSGAALLDTSFLLIWPSKSIAHCNEDMQGFTPNTAYRKLNKTQNERNYDSMSLDVD